MKTGIKNCSNRKVSETEIRTGIISVTIPINNAGIEMYDYLNNQQS